MSDEAKDMNELKDREQQINALIDGELDKDEVAALMAVAAQEPALQRQLAQAQQLQQALRHLPAQRAPRSLRNKLQRIGREEGHKRRATLSWWQWGAIAAAIPLLLIISPGDRPGAPSTAEIEQGRRDLAVALGYLGRAGQEAALEIDGSISRAVLGSIRENTLEALRHQMDTREELLL